MPDGIQAQLDSGLGGSRTPCTTIEHMQAVINSVMLRQECGFAFIAGLSTAFQAMCEQKSYTLLCPEKLMCGAQFHSTPKFMQD